MEDFGRLVKVLHKIKTKSVTNVKVLHNNNSLNRNKFDIHNKILKKDDTVLSFKDKRVWVFFSSLSILMCRNEINKVLPLMRDKGV